MATKKVTTTTSAAAAAPAKAAAPKKASVPKKVAPVAAAPKPATSKPATSKPTAPKKKVAAAAAPGVISVETLQDEIRSEAYNYFIQRGYRPGDPVADWHRAEDAVLRRHGLR